VDRDRLRASAEGLLCAATGADRLVRLCPACGSAAHGRPVAVGSAASVSLAYAGDLAVVAWSYDGPVGVDVERAGPPVAGVGDRAAWTRVEALLKASGAGVSGWPEVELPDLPTTPLGPPGLPPGYVGTLAGAGARWRIVPDVLQGSGQPNVRDYPGGPAARGGPARP
jgi:hypothetical protein